MHENKTDILSSDSDPPQLRSNLPNLKYQIRKLYTYHDKKNNLLNLKGHFQNSSHKKKEKKEKIYVQMSTDISMIETDIP